MPKFVDFTGMRFGKLTVLKLMPRNKLKQTMWLCECDCGNKKIIVAQSLKDGKTKSCGCYQKEFPSKKTHGERWTRLYSIWIGMRKRCYTKTSKSYYCYGKIGITICKEWDKYEVFRDWANSNGYRDNLTIDRIDPYGNYEPNNCRWATVEEQSINKKITLYIKIDGIDVPFAKYVKTTNKSYGCLYKEMKKKGLLYKIYGEHI